jgi:hypothetical protein
LPKFSQHCRAHSHSYRAYGLTLHSDVAIPGLQPSAAALEGSDVSLEIGPEPPPWFLDAKPLDSYFRYSEPDTREAAGPAYTLRIWGQEELFDLAYSDGGRFLIDAQATRVWGLSPPLSIDEVAVYLRGPIMGFLLRRRSVAALHACAVSMDNRAIVLCGSSESGKSTTAAALALQGVPVLCDDITPLREVAREFHADPGYPRICLWPDVVEPLMGKPDSLPKLTPTWEKCYLPLDSKKASFANQSQRIGVVYLISPRVADTTAPRIEPISSSQALLELIQNTYMNWLLSREQRAAEFDVLARFVGSVPVRRLVPHANPDRITALAELILRDAEQVTSASICVKP